MTRGQTAQMLYEAAGKPTVSEHSPFTDVSAAYDAAVSWAVEQGLVNGVGDSKFSPDTLVTRQEFATILYRGADSPAVHGKELQAYADESTVANWAYDAMLWCNKTGLLNGKSASMLAPKDTIIVAEAAAILQRAELLPDTEKLEKDLQTIAAEHRPIGSEGEQAAAAYLESRFSEMGYQVSTQTYTNDAGQSGTNVIAVLPAASTEADILVLSAHHDSVPTAYGANDNASGVTALLAVAEQLKDVSTDTELRFISFTDEENGKNGSRYYVSTLTENERSRIVGDIQLDMLGGLGAEGVQLCTTDGEPNWLTDLLQGKNASLTITAETASDHTSFQLAEIPSVLVMQKGRGYLYHTAADVAGQIDLHTLAGAAQMTAAAVHKVMGTNTDSYRTVAQAQGAGYTYRQTRQNVIYFASSLEDTEAYIGAKGTLVDSYSISGNGWTDRYETYRYSMRWFGGETPMDTDYEYRNGFLERIQIYPEKSGYSAEQIRTLICGMYGDPISGNGETESWKDEIYSKYITLADTDEGCCITVSNYSEGITNILACYPVTNGNTQIEDTYHARVWDFVCSILPPSARTKIAEFNLFSDGYSNVLAYTSPLRSEDGTTDNTRFSVNIDYYDVYDEDGTPRDWSKLTYTILHEYGHVLLEDETQIDLHVGADTHDPAGFISGSFRANFYDAFWRAIDTGTGVNDYEQNPTHYVSRYGANYFHEDIADTFAVFVLGAKPEGDTIAEQKLLFFWNDADMVTLRQEIRQNLGLEQSQQSEQPDIPPSPGGTPTAVSSLDEIRNELERAIAATQQLLVLDISALPATENLEIDVRNQYYAILSAHPEYKYAYDVRVEIEDDNTMQCTIDFMPYHSGNYPAGFDGVSVDSLQDLIQTAEAHLAEASVAIRITDAALQVDDMNKALQQVGGGYILCQLNRDGTAITFTPQNNLSHTEAVDRLQAVNQLADEIVASCISSEMSEMEKAEALYTYLTETVRYDQRYYSDRNNMPYDAQTAYGALHDQLAICGGFAQALQVLFEKIGISCYTVSGSMGEEYHMWNVAYLDGAWRYFDPTSDRGRAEYWFNYFGVSASQLTHYVWDTDFISYLTQTTIPEV